MNYFDNKRKKNVNFLFLKFKFVTIYNVNFDNILKTHRVLKLDDKKFNN